MSQKRLEAKCKLKYSQLRSVIVFQQNFGVNNNHYKFFHWLKDSIAFLKPFTFPIPFWGVSSQDTGARIVGHVILVVLFLFRPHIR